MKNESCSFTAPCPQRQNEIPKRLSLFPAVLEDADRILAMQQEAFVIMLSSYIKAEYP